MAVWVHALKNYRKNSIQEFVMLAISDYCLHYQLEFHNSIKF